MAKLNIKNAIVEKTKQALNNSYISSEQIKQNIMVLEELRSFIPSPTLDEYDQLEQNILKNGCKDALLLWETTQGEIDPNSPSSTAPAYVLVDGHNRYQICRNRNIHFNVQVMSFPSIKEVKDYMIDLQLGRRNLTPQQTSYFRGLRYNLEKTDKGRYDRNEHKSQNGTYDKNPISTSEKLAKEYNVGRNTILRDAEFASGLDKLDNSLKNAVLSGEIKMGKSDIQKLAKVEQNELIASTEVLNSFLSPKEDTILANIKAKGSFESTKKQLSKITDKVLNSNPTPSPKDIDKLIEIATKLKGLL